MAVIRFNGAKLDPATIAALVSGTLVNGSKPSAWWRRQSADFRNSFMDTIRTSMRNGESLTQAITRVTGGTIDGVTVPGILKTTKAKAGALTATAQNAVANEAALRTFQENNDVIKAVMQVSTLDNKTSDICIAYSGQVWDVNSLKPISQLGSTLPFNGGPPRHFNCRSRLRPVTKSFRELGIDADEVPTGTRASMDGQVPADITFDKFLKGKSQSFQDNLLGPKRARLWRDDKINLTQLVDMRGNPMTLSQLEQRLGIKAARDPLKRAAPVIKQDPEAGFKAALEAEKQKTLAAKAAKKKADDAAKAAEQARRDEKARRLRAERAQRRAEKKAAAAKEAEEKAARIAKAEKEAEERARAAAGEDMKVITDPRGVRVSAHKFLKKNNVKREYWHLIDDMLEMLEESSSVSFGPEQRKAMLTFLKPRIEDFKKKLARRAAQAKNAVTSAPQFKTVKQAQDWFEKNLINPDSNFGKPVGKGKFTGDKVAYKLTADVTLMMRDRFGLSLPNYVGMRSQHVFNFGRSSAYAAVHMESDSLLIIARGMKRQERLMGGWSQRTRYFGTDTKNQKFTVGTETFHASYNGEREQIRRILKERIDEVTDSDLKRALKAALADDDYTHTVTGSIVDADYQFWKTMIHESGHRIHGQHYDELNALYKQIRNPTGDRIADARQYSDWIRATSKYSGQNREEFIAEQFTMYMTGRHRRVHPLLLKFFKRLDNGGDFEQDLFKQHMGA